MKVSRKLKKTHPKVFNFLTLSAATLSMIPLAIASTVIYLQTEDAVNEAKEKHIEWNEQRN